MGFFVLFMCMYVCMYAGMYVCMCMCTWPKLSTNHNFQKDTVVADIALRLGPDVGIFFSVRRLLAFARSFNTLIACRDE